MLEQEIKKSEWLKTGWMNGTYSSQILEEKASIDKILQNNFGIRVLHNLI